MESLETRLENLAPVISNRNGEEITVYEKVKSSNNATFYKVSGKVQIDGGLISASSRLDWSSSYEEAVKSGYLGVLKDIVELFGENIVLEVRSGSDKTSYDLTTEDDMWW